MGKKLRRENIVDELEGYEGDMGFGGGQNSFEEDTDSTSFKSVSRVSLGKQLKSFESGNYY